MHSFIKLAITAALAVQAQAKTIQIKVGSGGLSFTPNSVTAAKGDVLEFEFYPMNHSVAMGNFDKPCAPATTGGFFSGYVPVAKGQTGNTFSVTVNSTDPMVFYCTTGKHCQSGMYGVVNGAGTKSLQTYGSAANKTQSSSAPASVFGGSLKAGASGTNKPPATTATGTPKSGSDRVKAGFGSLAGALVMAAFLA